MATRPCGFHQPIDGQHTGRRERGDLTEAVSGGGIGLDPEFIEQRQLRKADGCDRRLGGLHRGQRVVLHGAGLVVEGRFRVDRVVQVGEIAGQTVPDLKCLGKSRARSAPIPM